MNTIPPPFNSSSCDTDVSRTAERRGLSTRQLIILVVYTTLLVGAGVGAIWYMLRGQEHASTVADDKTTQERVEDASDRLESAKAWNPKRFPAKATADAEGVAGGEHFIAGDEFGFIMNRSQGFVRLPSECNWTKAYGMQATKVPVNADGRISIHDDSFRFTATLDELKEWCGDGTRGTPMKWKLVSVRKSTKEYPYHITELLVQYRDSRSVDIIVDGYVFDK